MITIKDVARKARVQENTAIRALAGKIMGKRRDAKERMERVLKAASELGYRPCEFAKSLRKGKTNTIGLVVGSITNRYFSALVEIVMDEAERNGYRMILELTRWDAEKKQSVSDPAESFRSFRQHSYGQKSQFRSGDISAVRFGLCREEDKRLPFASAGSKPQDLFDID